MAKKKDIKTLMSTPRKDINNCWSVSALFDLGQGRRYTITMTGAPAATKSQRAKSLAYEALEMRCAEFMAEHPGATMLNYREEVTRRRARPLK